MLCFEIHSNVAGRLLLHLTLLVFTLICCGCGGSSDHVKVSGKVTYDDGSLIPVKGLQVVFYPQVRPRSQAASPKSEKNPRVGRAAVNEKDGTFDTVTTYRYGDGLPPGKYVVTLEDVERRLPAEYASPDAALFHADTKDSPFTFLVKKPRSKKGRR